MLAMSIPRDDGCAKRGIITTRPNPLSLLKTLFPTSKFTSNRGQSQRIPVQLIIQSTTRSNLPVSLATRDIQSTKIIAIQNTTPAINEAIITRQDLRVVERARLARIGRINQRDLNPTQCARLHHALLYRSEIPFPRNLGTRRDQTRKVLQMDFVASQVHCTRADVPADQSGKGRSQRGQLAPLSLQLLLQNRTMPFISALLDRPHSSLCLVIYAVQLL